MAVLSDRTIEHLRREGALDIAPFEPQNLTPNGYDLTIGEVLLPEVEGGPVTVTEGSAEVPGHGRFLVATAEVVTLGAGVTAQLWIRSSFARRGLIAAFGKVEAGFSGSLTIGGFNASAGPVSLPVGERFCQIAFEALTEDAAGLYAERSGTYQDQRGVTLARDR